ncbi:MAG: hypothetical protein ACUVQP_12575, partial [Bacteroidales bacterium]
MSKPEGEPNEEQETRKPDRQSAEEEQSEEEMKKKRNSSETGKPNGESEEAEVNTDEEKRVEDGGKKEEQYMRRQIQDLGQQIQESFEAISKEFLKTVNGLKLRKLIEQTETRIKKENPDLDPDDPKQYEKLKKLVEQEVLREMELIKGELRTAFIQIISAEDENQLNRFTINLLSKIDNLLKEENLTEEEAKRLTNLVNRLKEIKILAFEHNSSLKLSGPEKELEYFHIVLTDKSRKVAFALYDVKNFITFLRDKGYLDDSGHFKEELFPRLYEEIRELFEEVISTIDTKPGQYFENAFNPMYEQTYYNLLVQRLRIIGGELRDRYPDLSKTLISIDDPQILRYGYDSEKGAERRMAYAGLMKESFDYVIGVVLAQDMSRLLNIHRVLHNAEHVVDEGYGFEELAKYIDQISIEEIVWLFRANPQIVEAYNLYLKNLIQELALNNWVIPTNFGHKDRENLDYAQRLTITQLLAKKNGHQDVREFYKTARMVKIASALAKSVTGEFWSILLSSRFLISEKETKEGVGKIEELFTGAHH